MRILKDSPATTHKRIRTGELQVVRVGPRKLMVEPQVIRDFIAERRSNGPVNDDGRARTRPAVTTSAEAGGGVDAA